MEKPVRYKVEPMAPGDFEAVLHLWRNTEGVGLSDSDSPPNLAAYLQRNPAMSFVAWDGAEIAGAVLCGHDGRRGYLHHLAVAKAHRKQGLGKRLVSACLSGLAAQGILKCNIFLYSNNAEGEAFWRHNGWMKREDLEVVQKTLCLDGNANL